MALTYRLMEQLTEWCAESESIGDFRARARAEFFAYDDPRPVNYVDGTEDIDSRERRFLGWFAFDFKLPDGRCPIELAANTLLQGTELNSVLEAIRNTRYVMAVVSDVTRGQAFFLELQEERFKVISHTLSHRLRKGSTVCMHILPVGRGRWLSGPGWSVWPIRFGPGMRAHLKELQPSPIQVERFLQQRVDTPEELQNIEYPRDDTLEAAVARMSQAARREGREGLIMETEEWRNLVCSYMTTRDTNGFVEELYRRMGAFKSIEDANRWLALATNIWNTTPQPDRGGKSANELVEYQQRAREVNQERQYQDTDYEAAQLLAHLRSRPLARLEQSWRRDIEAKPLSLNSMLQAALSKLPVPWIDGICLCLAVPAERKRQDKVTRIIACLSSETGISTIVRTLSARCREAVTHVLKNGGWVKYNQLSRQFGDEKGDGWWWDKEPPQSTIGELRLRGLLFVGQAAVGSRRSKVAIIPRELREPILKAVEAIGTSTETRPPVKTTEAHYYQTLGDLLSQVKLQFGTFATEDESLRRYYEQFMFYWSKTDYAEHQGAEGFGVEEYLYNFRLPGSDQFLVDCFLEQRGEEIPERTRRGLLNWRGVHLRCCRIVAIKGLLLLEDLNNGARMWCFSLNIGGVETFRGLEGDTVISYICPWDSNTYCLLGYSAVLATTKKRSAKTSQELEFALRDVTEKTQRYFARLLERTRRELPEIPEVFLKAFENESGTSMEEKDE